MIRFTPIPDNLFAMCGGGEEDCDARPTAYVWDDSHHEDWHLTASVRGLCGGCWHGNAACSNESHIADVLRRVLDTVAYRAAVASAQRLEDSAVMGS